MQPYLVHLMHKKDKNWNFWTNLAPKMVFLALFGPVKCQIQMGWPHLALPPAMPLRQVQMNVSLALADGYRVNYMGQNGQKWPKMDFFPHFGHLAHQNGIFVNWCQNIKVAHVSDGRFGTLFGALGLAVGAFGALHPLEAHWR